jgi:hypothetical protein
MQITVDSLLAAALATPTVASTFQDAATGVCHHRGVAASQEAGPMTLATPEAPDHTNDGATTSSLPWPTRERGIESTDKKAWRTNVYAI